MADAFTLSQVIALGSLGLAALSEEWRRLEALYRSSAP